MQIEPGAEIDLSLRILFLFACPIGDSLLARERELMRDLAQSYSDLAELRRAGIIDRGKLFIRIKELILRPPKERIFSGASRELLINSLSTELNYVFFIQTAPKQPSKLSRRHNTDRDEYKSPI